MKRPSFQFYPGDWQANSNLRRCTHAEKGAWVDVLCLLHDQAEYGVLRWPLREIAQAVGCTTATLNALVTKGVLKGSDTELVEPYVYVPRSGRKDGELVVLLAPQAGPIWYSSRMVKDEHVRTVRGEGTRFGDPDGASPKEARISGAKAASKPPLGDGPSSSSSSSTSVNTPNSPPEGGTAPPGKRRRSKTGEVTLAEWLAAIQAAGENAIPKTDPVFTYAESIGLPREFLNLAWAEFKARYTAEPVKGQRQKTYTDWRAVFRKAVREGWLKLWYLDGQQYALTAAGQQAQRAVQAQQHQHEGEPA